LTKLGVEREENANVLLKTVVILGRETNIAYWTALLSINGLFIALFSAAIILEKIDTTISAIFIAFSIVASGALIYNFYLIVHLYRKIGKAISKDKIEEQFVSLQSEAIKSSPIFTYIEFFSITIVCIQIIVSLFFLFHFFNQTEHLQSCSFHEQSTFYPRCFNHIKIK